MTTSPRALSAETVTMPGWDRRQLAACRHADPKLFLPVSVSGPSSDQVTQAKAICAGWPVRRQYPAFALDTRQNHGVWGAMTEKRSAAHGQPRRARGPDPRALVDHMRGSAAVAIGAALAVAIVISGPHNCAGAPRRRPPGRQLTLAADCAVPGLRRGRG
jgi:WhiB family redox-sensing transcriptional regulator